MSEVPLYVSVSIGAGVLTWGRNGTFLRSHLTQKSPSSKVTLLKSHFYQKSPSSEGTFLKSHSQNKSAFLHDGLLRIETRMAPAHVFPSKGPAAISKFCAVISNRFASQKLESNWFAPMWVVTVGEDDGKLRPWHFMYV